MFADDDQINFTIGNAACVGDAITDSVVGTKFQKVYSEQKDILKRLQARVEACAKNGDKWANKWEVAQ